MQFQHEHPRFGETADQIRSGQLESIRIKLATLGEYDSFSALSFFDKVQYVHHYLYLGDDIRFNELDTERARAIIVTTLRNYEGLYGQHTEGVWQDLQEEMGDDHEQGIIRGERRVKGLRKMPKDKD